MRAGINGPMQGYYSFGANTRLGCPRGRASSYVVSQTSRFRGHPDFGPIPLSPSHFSLRRARVTRSAVRKRGNSVALESTSYGRTNQTAFSQHWVAAETVPPRRAKNQRNNASH